MTYEPRYVRIPDVDIFAAASDWVWLDRESQSYYFCKRGIDPNDVAPKSFPHDSPAKEIINNLIRDVRVLAAAFGFYPPMSLRQAEALMADDPDPIEAGKLKRGV